MRKQQAEDHVTPASEEAVLEFLHRRPDFLLDQPELLARLELPHHAGEGTVSLVERQVSILRERNISMRHRLSNLLGTARRNEELFEKTRRLTLKLAVGSSNSLLADALFDSFDQDFGVGHTRLLLDGKRLPASNFDRCRHQQRILCADGKQWQTLNSLTPAEGIFTGKLPAIGLELIFGQSHKPIGSVAIAPLRQGTDVFGYIALGNVDEHYYQACTDSLFLAHITQLLALRLNTEA